MRDVTAEGSPFQLFNPWREDSEGYQRRLHLAEGPPKAVGTLVPGTREEKGQEELLLQVGREARHGGLRSPGEGHTKAYTQTFNSLIRNSQETEQPKCSMGEC